MCTSIAMKTNDFYFGRNMDMDRSFGARVVITPRNFPLPFRLSGTLSHHYAMIGMATVTENYPLYAEAVNERGLCMAGLNFPDNACYANATVRNKKNISPFELIPWVLSTCATVAQARRLLEQTNVIAIPFSDTIPLATLHWHIADETSSLVLEVMADGMHLYDNPVHVLTNNPPFPFHLHNLSQYLNLTVTRPENCFCQAANIQPFGKGLGSFGLPGDFSPGSRFVRVSYLLLNSRCSPDEESSVTQFFHILGSVNVINGSIVLGEDSTYCTTYSCCINASRGIYYYKSYTNNQIRAIRLQAEPLNSTRLKEFSLVTQQQFAFEN